jgi:DNA transformation protein and related proteins
MAASKNASEGAIEGLPNLGPKSAAMLASAGIERIEQLRQLGSVAAFVKVKAAVPSASLNLLWAMEGALAGLSWQQVAHEHRASLLLSLEHCQQRNRKPDEGE